MKNIKYILLGMSVGFILTIIGNSMAKSPAIMDNIARVSSEPVYIDSHSRTRAYVIKVDEHKFIVVEGVSHGELVSIAVEKIE